MKVFISWSGERSKLVAELLEEWIPSVIQAIKPWISSKHIDGDSVWFNKIMKELADTKVAIVCLTKGNLHKPWILFEAGAAVKGMQTSRVCTFLIDLNDKDILDSPLTQFNFTLPTEASLLKLLTELNKNHIEPPLKDEILNRAFKRCWPEFEDRFNKILQAEIESQQTPVVQEKDVISEILSNVRTINKRLNSIELTSNNVYIPNRLAAAEEKLRGREEKNIKLIRTLLSKGKSNTEIITSLSISNKLSTSLTMENFIKTIMEIRSEFNAF